MGIAVEAVFGVVVPSLNLDQTDIELGIPVRSEGQRAGDVQRAKRMFGLHVVDDDVALAHLDPGAGGRNFTSFPGSRVGPGATAGGTDNARRFGRPNISRDEAGDES